MQSKLRFGAFQPDRAPRIIDVFTRFSLATSVSWKEKDSPEYTTRTEWDRVICWGKLADWAGALQSGAYAEVEGELHYREYTPVESDPGRLINSQ